MTIPLRYGKKQKSDVAVLILGFGGPECFDEVRPFIENVTRGRNVPPERLDSVVEQYRRIGGKSPYNEWTSKQANALITAMQEGRQEPINAYVGMLYSAPSIEEAVEAMSNDGVRRAVTLIMAPHRSQASFERYIDAAFAAVQKLGLRDKLNLDLVEPWHTDKLFVSAIASQVQECLRQNGLTDKTDLQSSTLIFTAHSIPLEMSQLSGYARQVEETAAAVADMLSASAQLKEPVAWTVGYQSRSGSPRQPWLEPDVTVRIDEACKRGCARVIVVPIGFLCDHAEVLFDLDVLAAEAAANMGMIMLRARTVGDHPSFIRLLATIARDRIESGYVKPGRQ